MIESTPERHYTYSTMKYPGELHFHFYHKVSTPLHSHDFYELFIVLSGVAKHTFEGVDEELTLGDVRLISPNQQHKFHNVEGKPVHFNIALQSQLFKTLCDSIDESAFDFLSSKNNRTKLSDKEFDYIKSLADKAYSFEDGRSTATAKVIVQNLIMIFLNSKSIHSDESLGYPAWIQTFCEKLASPEYFLKPIRELYKLAPYSQPVLNATFKQHTGETLVSYITKQKMNYASNLLKLSNYTILEISELSLYSSLSHFNHTFKKHTGYTPSEYRKLYGKKM